MKKRIYISGQITGLGLKEAERNFAGKEFEIESDGHIPVNPMKILKGDYIRVVADGNGRFCQFLGKGGNL